MEYSLHKLSIQNNRWIEKNIEKGQEYYKKIEILSQTFSIPDYFSKHLVDNKIDNQEKFINFINPSIYFLYPPFLFKDIFNALRLISEAKNNDSPIFIFGDSDIDGIAGIKILYEALHKYGIKKIFYSIPENNEPYGISIEKIDLAIKRGAKLIITVDNGISCIKEVEYAKTKGLKVIITDHHNPKEDIPEADAIINPKLENFSYPSCLSGAGVAWKLVEALIFSQTRIFEQNIIFCNVEIKNFHSKSKNNYIANLTFLFIKNLRIYKQYNFSFYIDIEDFDNVLNFNNYNKTATFSLGKILTKEQASKNIFLILSEAIENNSIFISDQSDLLLLIFKDLSIKINLNDIKSIKSLINDDDDFLSILSTYKMFYINKIDYLYFILYSTIRYNYPKCIEELESYLPYVTIATIADIMPVFNENRYIIAKGLNIINENKPEFITQILSSVVGVNYPLTTYDIIWKISPLLNSPGR
ncbi:MAG: DHH family phosphoesterase, partial [Exilispira sp.]